MRIICPECKNPLKSLYISTGFAKSQRLTALKDYVFCAKCNKIKTLKVEVKIDE